MSYDGFPVNMSGFFVICQCRANQGSTHAHKSQASIPTIKFLYVDSLDSQLYVTVYYTVYLRYRERHGSSCYGTRRTHTRQLGWSHLAIRLEGAMYTVGRVICQIIRPRVVCVQAFVCVCVRRYMLVCTTLVLTKQHCP